MSRIYIANNLPFEIGALYNRRLDIHGQLGGQTQGGISTPANSQFVILFTGEAGIKHGYQDYWDSEGIFHYFGEGQTGDMQNKGGNRAISEHIKNNKRLLLFQMMGHGRPYRFLGELRFRKAYTKDKIPDSSGKLRTAIVFMLVPVENYFEPFQNAIAEDKHIELTLPETAASQLTEVRTKQSLFKRRLLTVEKHCRLTAIEDLRFLRASHIKPWAKCTNGDERVDGRNGLLLSPHADYLFDRGWITFENDGSLLRSSKLPNDVIEKIGLDLRQGRNCGAFFEEQKNYLDYHRNEVFDKSFRKAEDPVQELITTTYT